MSVLIKIENRYFLDSMYYDSGENDNDTKTCWLEIFWNRFLFAGSLYQSDSWAAGRKFLESLRMQRSHVE